MTTIGRRPTLAALVAVGIAGRVDAQAVVSLLDYHTTAPVTWVVRPPASSMRLAEYVIRAPGSRDSAEVIVYFFGKGQGGSVESNVERWKSQFSMPDGSAVPVTIVRDSSGAFPVSFVELRGTYARAVAGGAPDPARPGQILMAGIAETPRGTLFIQLFGAAARVSAERDAFHAFVKGLRSP